MMLALLQARVSSTRLPGKVLLPILGEPMLFRQVERLQRCRQIVRLVVATSIDPSDDLIAAECAPRGIDCARSSLDDVLDRFVVAARPFQPQAVVRLTGDCPLADPELIDEVIRFFRAGSYDYVSNSDPPGFPDGLDVEVIRFSCLLQAHREAVLPSHREHVTPFLRAHPDRFRLGNYASAVDRAHLRWTVDEPQDFEFVRQVYEQIYPVNPAFTSGDVLALLANQPELLRINAGIERNEGLKKSLCADAVFLTRQP